MTKYISQKTFLFYFLLIFLVIITWNIAVKSSLITADTNFDIFLYSIRSPLFLKIFSLITFLGSSYFIAAITFLVGIVLFVLKHRRYGIGLLITVAGAAATTTVLKLIVARARPDGLIPSIKETAYSFPSGHATAAAAFYGFLIYLLWRLVAHTGWKISLIFLLTLTIIAVGFSRLYLGVHYPSDVVAGFLVGMLWILIANKLITESE